MLTQYEYNLLQSRYSMACADLKQAKAEVQRLQIKLDAIMEVTSVLAEKNNQPITQYFNKGF